MTSWLKHSGQRIRQTAGAVAVVFTIFDVWGDRMRNLELMQVTDIPEGGMVQFDGSWYASENDVQEFYTSAAFVDVVIGPP